MKTIEIKVYRFDELSDEAKERALFEFCDYPDYGWWEGTYDDAENIGLKITEFDLDRNRYAKGCFVETAIETAEKILKNHGDSCETYKTAKKFLNDRDSLVAKYSSGNDTIDEDKEYEFDGECDDLEEEFLKSILEDYSIILQHELEYFQSTEYITKLIEINDYFFTENGKLS